MTGFDIPSAPHWLQKPIDRRKLVFLDIETSGLGAGSWPIEIGLARVREDNTVSIDEDLIRPHAKWSMAYWSTASARIHGIERSVLDAAPAAADVASRIASYLTGMIVVSDAPEFDGAWLLKLTRTVDRNLVIPIHDFDHLLTVSCDRRGLERAYATLDRLPHPHRAGADAARLARAWLAGATR